MAYENDVAEQQRRERSRRVYSTKQIDEIIRERLQGYEIDKTPFYDGDIELRGENVVFSMTQDELIEYQKCYDDPEYFIGKYCVFKTDDGNKTVELRDYQKKIINIVTAEHYDSSIGDMIPDNRNLIYMAARQTGKTTTICAFIAWKLIFHIDKNILVIANKESTAIEIVSKIANVFKSLPYFLKPGTVEWNKKSITLDNGSKIISSATTKTASIGFTIHLLLLDEFAHVQDSIVNSFWRSVYPTLSSSKVSQCIITSTPNGTTNKFYDIWDGAINHKNSFFPMRTDYWEVPGHDSAWAELQKADLGEEEFAQEFELQFNINSKMLLKADDLRFIDRMSTRFIEKPVYCEGSELLNVPYMTWHPDFDPQSIKPTDCFVFIVDLAEGNGDENERFKSQKKTPDSNTINIFKVQLNSESNIRKYSKESCSINDCFRFIQVGTYSSNSEDEIMCAKVCGTLALDLFHADENNNVKVMVEMNFNGKAFTEQLARHPKYNDFIIQRTFHTKPIPGEKQRRHKGFKTSGNKEYYCIKGNKMISKRRIVVTSIDSFEQMKSFGYVKGHLNGIACHDDLSMPIFNHIPRMLDDETFVSWLGEILYAYPDVFKRYKINQLLELWDLNNPSMDGNAFSTLYGLNSNLPSNQYLDMASRNPYSSNF